MEFKTDLICFSYVMSNSREMLNNTNKILLPESVLYALQKIENLSYPLFFKIIKIMSKLDRKTKRILQNLDMHTNSSVQHTKTVLDTESLLTIAGLSEPKTNVANSTLESIDATTKSVLYKLPSCTPTFHMLC